MLIGFGFVFLTLYCATISNAKIDPKTVVGIWLFDEGNGKITEDLSGNGNDGELKEGTKWEDGQFGQAVIFDGKDDYVEIAPSPLFNPETFTVTFWMHPTTVGGNNPGGRGQPLSSSQTVILETVGARIGGLNTGTVVTLNSKVAKRVVPPRTHR